MKTLLGIMAVIALCAAPTMAGNVVDGPVPINVTVAACCELHLDLTAVPLTIQQLGPITQGQDPSQIVRRNLTVVSNADCTVTADLSGQLPYQVVFWLVIDPVAGWTKPQSKPLNTVGEAYFEWYSNADKSVTAPTSGHSFDRVAGVYNVAVDYAIQVGGGSGVIPASGDTASATMTYTIAAN